MAVTRADVAALAGVSPALVSYVINNGPRPVSAAARARIEKAIEQLEYRPNRIAQALRGAATKTVGLLIPSATNRFFGELASAIEKELFEHGYSLTIGISADDRMRESRYIETFLDNQVDGIMTITSNSRANLERLRAELPTVVLDRVPTGIPVSSARVDNWLGVTEAVRHLHSHGHRRIACIGGREGTESADERVAAWESALAELEIPARFCPLVRADFTEEGGCTAALALLYAPAELRPPALFVSSDTQTTGVLRACHSLGVRIPEDLAIVSFDGTPLTGYSVPTITSYRQPTTQIAQYAVGNLLRQIADPSKPAVHTVLPGELSYGVSCGCPG